jgi:nicotinate-nucleotide adenylyltransferase
MTHNEVVIKKIGLFGGTFNPIHLGHLTVAQEVKEGFDLDKIWFIPAATPPHKKMKQVAESLDRLEMIRLAIADNFNFSVSDVELKRSGPSYTIDTVDYFKGILPKETQLYLIVGMDAFLDIELWKSYRDLFQVIPFIVMSRPGAMDVDPEEKRKALNDLLVKKVSPEYCFESTRNAFFHPKKQPVFLFEVTPVEISATTVRRNRSQGRSIASLVPKKVKEYIESKGLYL